MHMSPGDESEHQNRIALYWALFCAIKLLRAISFFAIYDILKGFHIITYLLLFKILCAGLLCSLQKPFQGQRHLTTSMCLRILRHAGIRVTLDIFWITGLTLCGPLRFVLLYEHGDVAIIALLSTVFIKSLSSTKSRGAAFFILGVLWLIFFDHDMVDRANEHPEGVHKSFLIHRIYELFIHLGLSDHKTGAVLLLLTAFGEAGFNSAAHSLAASLGGSKRLFALSTCVSVPITFLLLIVAAFFDTIFFHDEPLQLGQFGYLYGVIVTTLIALIFIADFYFCEFLVKKVGLQSVQRASYPCLTLITCLISAILGVSANLEESGHSDAIISSTRPAHYLSSGAIISLFIFLYASNLLSQSNLQGNGKFNSRRFVGFSAAGLPLYTNLEVPAIDSGVGGDGVGLKYHVVEILNKVTGDRGSFRIFVFLCLNLSFTFIELFYGVWTNSLGLISDGFHMLFDCAALVMGLYASVIGRWKPNHIYSYGFHRAEILSGFINSLALLVISVSIALNAIERIQKPPDISTDRLMAVSVGGLLVNLVGIFALGHAHSHGGGSSGCASHSHGHHHSHSHSAPGGVKETIVHGVSGLSDVHDALGDDDDQDEASGDSNLRGVYLHVLADTLGSVGVIISSFFVTNFGWNIADPICSLFISGAITYSAVPLIKDTVGILALRSPPKRHPAHPQRILQKVLQLDSVLEVINPCIWQNTENTICCSMRLRIAPTTSEQLVLAQIKETLKRQQISHLTIQLEKEEYVQHIDVIGLHLDTIARLSRDSASGSQSNGPRATDHSGPTGRDGAGWTTISF